MLIPNMILLAAIDFGVAASFADTPKNSGEPRSGENAKKLAHWVSYGINVYGNFIYGDSV